jgi:hypothetical protein
MLLIVQLHQLTLPAGLRCACSLQAPACSGAGDTAGCAGGAAGGAGSAGGAGGAGGS